MAVLREIADRKGIDVTDLQTPLHDVVDPDALDRLFPSKEIRVTFEYLGYVVTVEGAEQVDLEKRQSA